MTDKVTRQCPQTTTFLKRKESRCGVEPRSFRLPAYRLTARPNRLTGGRPGFPVPNERNGFCGRKATFEEEGEGEV